MLLGDVSDGSWSYDGLKNPFYDHLNIRRARITLFDLKLLRNPMFLVSGQNQVPLTQHCLNFNAPCMQVEIGGRLRQRCDVQQKSPVRLRFKVVLETMLSA